MTADAKRRHYGQVYYREQIKALEKECAAVMETCSQLRAENSRLNEEKARADRLFLEWFDRWKSLEEAKWNGS